MPERHDRIASLDVARGGTILLVVLWHSFMAAQTLGRVDPAIATANYALQSVRMPLFFFCSGILAFWGLDRGWGRVLGGRVWVMVWIYLVWSTLTLLADQVYPIMPWRPDPQTLPSFLWLSYSSQWFIYALICATLFARSVYYLHVGWQVALTFAAQAALDAWSPDVGGLTTNFEYLVSTMASYGLLFFMGGIWLARYLVPLLAERRRAWAAFLGGFAAWLAIYGAQAALGIDVPHAVKAAPGVLAGLALAALVSALPAIRAPMQWVGQRTLEIFVCHQFVIGLATLACAAAGTGPTAAFGLIAATTWAVTVAFAWATTAGAPRLLFRPPRLAGRRPRAAGI